MPNKENKYRYWVMTLQTTRTVMVGSISLNDDYLPHEDQVVDALRKLTKSYVFQKEVTPTSGRDHYQCVFETTIRKRQSTLIREFASELLYSDPTGIQIDRMLGTWEEAVAYCSKSDTRKEGSMPFFSHDLIPPYKGDDIELLADPSRRYPWQNELFEILFESVPDTLRQPDGRTVVWITDYEGATGKSKLVKYLCYHNDDITKISFGSAGQLRSAIVSAGAKKLYFIDMPRTLGTDDSVNNVISAVEDIVNGFVVGNFYGKHAVLMCDPPHVVIFSNKDCPVEKLSGDRWKIYYIVDKRLKEPVEGYVY
jgi:hypothetical protein